MACVSPSPTYELESGGFEIRASVRLTGTGKLGGGGGRVTRAWIGREWSPNRWLPGRQYYPTVVRKELGVALPATVTSCVVAQAPSAQNQPISDTCSFPPPPQKQKSLHPITPVPTGRGAPNLEGGVENRVSGALSVSNQPRGPWVPPWGWVLLAAAVFHQILRKDPREEATGQRIATSSPSGLTASPAQGPSQGGARVHRV